MATRSPFWVKTLPADQPPYRIDPDTYRRFDQRNNLTVGRPNWDETIRAFTKKVGATRAQRIQSGQSGYGIRDYGLFLAAGAVAFEFGTGINAANRGLTAWMPEEGKPVARDARWEGAPADAAAMVKRAARFFGADIVGIAPLNPLWIYSHAMWEEGEHKEIVFEMVDTPNETEHQLVIPKAMQWVIVMGKRMDSGTLAYAPSPIGCAETRITYSRMALLVSTLAQFLRGLGYHAIPSINDLGLNIPMAIDAGFGEQGRNGKLITPEFGPSVRLCKVVTDLPLQRDYPIRFGVAEFCGVCQKCATGCPCHAISQGERSWMGPNISNSAGHYVWHLNNESCRRYWAMGPADNCTVCIRVCPFTKPPGWIHDVTRAAISTVPALDPLWRRLDDLLGYGNEKDTAEFWNGG
ncbi:MAG: reductive dehalogenase [Acidobacteriota bacterium]